MCGVWCVVCGVSSGMGSGQSPNAIAQAAKDTAMRTANSFASVMVCYGSFSKDEYTKDSGWLPEFVFELPWRWLFFLLSEIPITNLVRNLATVR